MLREEAVSMPDDVELAMFTALFDARPGGEESLAALLARYVVMTRREPACRNVDLVASTTVGGRFLVVEKRGLPRHTTSPFGCRDLTLRPATKVAPCGRAALRLGSVRSPGRTRSNR